MWRRLLLFLVAVLVVVRVCEVPLFRHAHMPLSALRLLVYVNLTLSALYGHAFGGSDELNANSVAENSEIIQVCDERNSNNSFIYCSGKLLEAVMYHRLYEDSKTYVDKPLKTSPQEVIAQFETRFPMSVSEIDRGELQRFVDEYFYEEGTELMNCTLDDWGEKPLRLAMIRDETLRNWAMELHKIWLRLCRRVHPKVGEEPDRFSLLYVPRNFIIPGGRFREYYYWDAYWIIKGLIASGMTETSKNMIRNLVYIVEKYGFIPNGGRVYYLRRSQPPLLTGMVYEYYEATRDTDFILEVLPVLEKELEWWQRNRMVDVTISGRNYSVFQYNTKSNVPRPESYREDMGTVKQLTKESEKRRIWRNLASAAESGWDFSSRWFADAKNIHTIETTSIVPVDLNAFICWNLNILSYLYDEMGNEDKSSDYRLQMSKFRNIFQKVFYVNNESGWFDYNMRSQSHNFNFYPSIVVPLFTRCYHSMNRAKSERIFNKMESMGVFNYTGGVPTSLNKESSEQWDFPNGWSPLNHMIIEGLRYSDNPRMQEKAFWLAEKWVLSNYRVFKFSQSMWEKYNVIGTVPSVGAGGEYHVQAGFGWTNGVILDLLTTYSNRMAFPNVDETPDITVDTTALQQNKDWPEQHAPVALLALFYVLLAALLFASLCTW